MSPDDNSKNPPYSEDELRDLADSGQPDPPDYDRFKNRENQNPRPSLWSKVRSAAVSYGRRLLIREAVVGEIPGVNIAVAGYETYRFGREVYHFIEEERAIAKTAQQTATKEKLPFFKVEEQSAGVGTIKHDPKRNQESLVVHEDQKQRFFDSSPDDPKYNYVFANTRVYRPSLEAKVSKAGSDPIWQAQEHKLIAEATQASANFQKKYLIGTAQDKYQFFLDTAQKALGRDYFDRVYHPDRVLRFEQFAVERLHIDGHTLSEIGWAVEEKSPFIVGVDREKYVEPILQQFVKQERELQQFRQALADWRLSKGIAETDRRTPKEHELAEVLREKVVKQEAEALLKNKYENTLGMLEKYRANPEMKLSTREEYQVELARRLKKIDPHDFKPREQDKQITFSLIMAGHKQADIEKALEESSLFAKENYGREIYAEVQQETKNNPIAYQLKQHIELMRKTEEIPKNETRLDKLDLEYKPTAQQTEQPSISRPNRSYPGD